MSRGRRRTLDLTRAGLLVEALGVARLDDVEGRVDEDLDEREAGLLVEVADDGAVRAEGRDERGEGDARRVREQLRDLHVARAAKGRGRVCFRGSARNQGGRGTHLADAADVLRARLLVEAEVLVQAEADVVAVEAVGELVEVEEVLLESAGNRRLDRR